MADNRQHIIFATGIEDRDQAADHVEAAIRMAFGPDWELLASDAADAAIDHEFPDPQIIGGARRGDVVMTVVETGHCFDPEYVRGTLAEDVLKAKYTHIAAPSGFDYAAELVGKQRVTYVVQEFGRGSDRAQEWWIEFRTPGRANRQLLEELRGLVAEVARQWHWPQVDYPWLNPVIVRRTHWRTIKGGRG